MNHYETMHPAEEYDSLQKDFQDTKYPQYYAELHSNMDGTKQQHYACDTMAVTKFVQEYGDDLMAVIKDDGEGNITTVQEFK